MKTTLITTVLSFSLLFQANLTLAQSAKAPVRFIALETWSMPFGQLSSVNGKLELIGGANKDWQEALAEELGRPIQIVVAPPKRRDAIVKAKAADILCMVSPEWVDAQRYDWIEPYFTIDEQLVGHKSQAIVQKSTDLHGKIVGTVKDYHYPLLDDLFARKKSIREDAPTEDSAYRKQIYRRVDYTIMRSADFYYRRNLDPAAVDLTMSPLVINHTPVHCALIKGSHINLHEFKEAQRRLIAKRSFGSMLEKYF